MKMLKHTKLTSMECPTELFSRLGAENSQLLYCSYSRYVHFVPSHVQAVGIWETMSPTFIDLWHEDLKKNPKKVAELPLVLCVTITTILKRLGITHVDLWILDTDGTEEDVLRGLNPKEVNIFNYIIIYKYKQL